MPAKRTSFVANSFSLLKQTFSEWVDDKAPQLGAALAYYTVFSLAPLILVLLAVVGLLFHNDPGAWNKLTEQMSAFLAKSAVDTVRNVNISWAIGAFIIFNIRSPPPRVK